MLFRGVSPDPTIIRYAWGEAQMSIRRAVKKQPDVKNRTLRVLVISLLLILFGSSGAYIIQSDFRNVDVSSITIPAENGQWIVADLFKPKTATSKNRVPVVVICPGFERTKETLSHYSLELARRGMAVITIDPYNQGASSSTMQKQSASKEGYGVVAMVEYIYNTPNLNYIDKTKIGITGYSAGGNAVLQVASLFGANQTSTVKKVKGATGIGKVAKNENTPTQTVKKPKKKQANEGEKVAGEKKDSSKKENPIFAVYAGGYILSITDKLVSTCNSNIGIDYALYDEGAFRSESKAADLRTAPESLRLVNSVLNKNNKISEVEIGKIYGDSKERTMRVIYNTTQIHPMLPYSPTGIARMIEYFTTIFDLKPSISASSQIWILKEIFTFLSLIGAFLFIIPFSSLLLKIPVFSSLVHTLPDALPQPKKKSKIIFWVTFAVSACIACYLFIPMARATEFIFPAATAATQTWWFPQRINNAILLWAVANGTIGLTVFFLTYRLYGKKNGITPKMWGLNIDLKELVKTFFLAFSVFAAFYVLLFAVYGIFHTDFRFTFVSAGTSFPSKMLLVALEYIPLFFVFYFANSVRVNCASRFKGQKEWISMLIMGLGNSVGLMAIIVIQYTYLISTGNVFWTTEWLYINTLIGVVPMMFILPYFNRYFFRLTGKVYLGPMVTCLIFIMMMLTSNVCYIPLK